MRYNEHTNTPMAYFPLYGLEISHFDAIMPLAAALLSAGLFTVAIQLSYRVRLVITPFMIGAAVVSLLSSSNLRLVMYGPEILSQVICIWIHHALAVLLIEPVFIPESLPRSQRRRFVRKIWNDPRRLTTFKSCEEANTPSSRLKFLEEAFKRLLFCVVLHKFFAVLDALIAPNQLTTEDFSPRRRVLLRRMLFPDPEAPITPKEMHIRAWMSVEWIWTSYLKISLYNIVASIIFVVILQLDSPQEWPPLFGSPLEAYSIQRFWGKFWHPLLKHPCATSGRFISRKLFRIPPRSRVEKTWLVFWTFFISGVNHAVVASALGYKGTLADSIRFRLSNFAAGAIEMVMGPILQQALRAHQDKPWGKFLRSRRVRRLFGYMWVFAVFFWIKPQERYAKLCVNLE